MDTSPLQPGPSGGSPGTHLCFCLTDAHSLCLDLAVTSQSRPGQPWCEVQGSMDTKPLLQYDSDSNQVTASGPLGEEVNGTKAWRDLTGTLGGVGESSGWSCMSPSWGQRRSGVSMGRGWEGEDSEQREGSTEPMWGRGVVGKNGTRVPPQSPGTCWAGQGRSQAPRLQTHEPWGRRDPGVGMTLCVGSQVLPGCRPSCAVSLKQSESPLPPGTSASMGRRPSSLTPWT